MGRRLLHGYVRPTALTLFAALGTLVTPWVAVGQSSTPEASEFSAAGGEEERPVELNLGATAWAPAPLYGGDVRSITFLPSDPDTVLAGTSSGQVFVSPDGGRVWRLAGDRVALPGWVVSDLIFDPHRPERVWAALWSVWGSEGAVVFSDDLGVSWTDQTNNLHGGQAYTLAFDPDHRQHLYAATRRGVWRTRDDGAHWEAVTSPELGKISSLLIDPYDSNTIYAGTWRRAYRSRDRGLTWTGIFEGMVLDSEVFSLVSGPDGEGDLWASTCGWVYHGTGRGARWQRHTDGFSERRTPSFDVLPSGRLLAGTVAGLYTSDNRGGRWVRRTPEVLAVSEIAFHPARPDRVFLGTEGAGVWVSQDGGTNYFPSNRGVTGLRISDVVDHGGEVWLAVRDTAAGSLVSSIEDARGVEQGTSATAAASADGPEPLPRVLDLASTPGVLYAATEKGLYFRGVERWQRAAALGEQRVEEVSTSSAGQVAVRTDRGVYWATSEGFEPIALSGRPRAAQWVGDELWVLDDESLRKVGGGPGARYAVPAGLTELVPLPDVLLASGPGGLWKFSLDGAGGWTQWAEAPARILLTEDARWPALFLSDGQQAVFYDRDRQPAATVHLPVHAHDVEGVLVRGDELFVATAGYGLWSTRLAEGLATGYAEVERSSP